MTANPNENTSNNNTHMWALQDQSTYYKRAMRSTPTSDAEDPFRSGC
jgi:hypothetical protein